MGSTGKGTATPVTAAGQIKPSDTPQIVATATQAQSANNANFDANNDQPYTGQLRQYYQQQTFGIDTQIAIQDYLYDQPVGGTLYSPSQLMNYKMKYGNDSQLTAQEKFMRDSLMEGMHNLGYDMNLEHYGRVSYIDSFGQLAMQQGLAKSIIDSSNFQNMTEAQLKKAFTGLTYQERGFLSTSCNSFSHAPAGNPFTDKAVKINVKAPASAQGLMPGNGPGGALGEMVLAPHQNYRITDVRFTGRRGRSGSNTYKQIEFDVEIY